MDSELPQPLRDLALAFEQLLREPEMSQRVAHHIVHVGPETWLSMELAFLVNSQEIEELSGWRAVLERGKVDVTLIPAEVGTQQVFLELKVVDRSYWGDAWTGIYNDLAGKPAGPGCSKDKPPATVAICFVVQPSCKTASRTQAKTLKVWEERFSCLPKAIGERFVPLLGQPPLRV
nr:hypothetical protein [Armatimonas sp.]